MPQINRVPSPSDRPHDAPTTPVRSIRHLNQIELSRRWSVSPRTLERWRWRRQGPAYLKIGGRVVYRLDDVEAYEAEQRRTAQAAAVR